MRRPPEASVMRMPGSRPEKIDRYGRGLNGRRQRGKGSLVLTTLLSSLQLQGHGGQVDKKNKIFPFRLLTAGPAGGSTIENYGASMHHLEACYAS